MEQPVVILDNGAGLLKAGYATDDAPRVMPNATMKVKGSRSVYVADQIETASNRSGVYYTRAFEKGYMTNFGVQREVWNHVLGKEGLKTNPMESGLIVTEPQFNFAPCQQAMDEAVFEEYGFASYLRSTGPELCARQSATARSPCCLVVDAGFSFTHVVPFYFGQRIGEGVRRIDVGGKALTSYLKETVSYRHLDMLEETYVVNQMKEDVSFVAPDFRQCLKESTKKPHDDPHLVEYVLPDFTAVTRGFIRPHEEMLEGLKRKRGAKATAEQTLRLSNERYRVPELLFSPSDVGIEQSGLSSCIVDSVTATHPNMHAALYANILLVGGSARIPGYKERIMADIRSLIPMEYTDVSVTLPSDPCTHIWHAGAALAKSKDFSKMTVTKAEYEEHGHKIFAERFGHGTTKKGAAASKDKKPTGATL